MTTTTTTPHPAVVALPPKAVKTEEWQPTTEEWEPDDGEGLYRNFEGENREVAAGTKYGAHAVAAYSHGVQRDDGSIEDGTGDEFFSAPGISISTVDSGQQTDIGITLTSEAARRLADVLVTAVAEVDGWSAR
jgi:hypothetical protein